MTFGEILHRVLCWPLVVSEERPWCFENKVGLPWRPGHTKALAHPRKHTHFHKTPLSFVDRNRIKMVMLPRWAGVAGAWLTATQIFCKIYIFLFRFLYWPEHRKQRPWFNIWAETCEQNVQKWHNLESSWKSGWPGVDSCGVWTIFPKPGASQAFKEKTQNAESGVFLGYGSHRFDILNLVWKLNSHWNWSMLTFFSSTTQNTFLRILCPVWQSLKSLCIQWLCRNYIVPIELQAFLIIPNYGTAVAICALCVCNAC